MVGQDIIKAILKQSDFHQVGKLIIINIQLSNLSRNKENKSA